MSNGKRERETKVEKRKKKDGKRETSLRGVFDEAIYNVWQITSPDKSDS